jgi:hypothetical protein
MEAKRLAQYFAQYPLEILMNIDIEYAFPTSCPLFIAFFPIWDAKGSPEGGN